MLQTYKKNPALVKSYKQANWKNCKYKDSYWWWWVCHFIDSMDDNNKQQWARQQYLKKKGPQHKEEST